MSQNDPTDNALAAIASILDKTEGQQPPPLPRETASPTADEKLVVDEKPIVEEKPLAPEQTEADGYYRVGPGPIASLRFKWTARRAEDGAILRRRDHRREFGAADKRADEPGSCDQIR